MDKITKLTLLVMVVLFVVLVQTVQLTLISKEKSIAGLVIASGSAASSAGTSIDTSQMTENEKMNYEMHGVIPARFGGGSQQSSGIQGLPQMVGGC